MRKSALALALILPLILIQPARADGILEFFFPMLKDIGPKPSQTLEAPFADHEKLKGVDKSAGLPEDMIAQDLPHRTTAQIADWLTTKTGESLTYTASDYRVDLAKIQKNFTPDGYQQYTAFLAQTALQPLIISGNISLHSYVAEPPLLINKGPINGSFKWLFEVTLIVSEMDKSKAAYKGVDNDPVNRKIILNVQVGRTTDKTADNGIIIEHWNGKLVSTSKNPL